MSALENAAQRVTRPDIFCTVWLPVRPTTLGMCVIAMVRVRTVCG
jgi:hypothetical protein